MSFDFAGIGGLSYDLVLRVDRFPDADSKVVSEYLGRFPGGFIANATVAAATLGLKTAHVGWVGDDYEGEMLAEDFLRAGVDISRLQILKHEITPFTVVMVNQEGERLILVPSFPVYRQPLSAAQLEMIRGAKIVYTEPRNLHWCQELAGIAHQHNGAFVLDIEHTGGLAAGDLRRVLDLTDVCFLSKESLALLSVDALDEIQSSGWLIMTAGKEGAYGRCPELERSYFQPAFPVEAVDTTGAGDCFHAAVLAGYVWGYSMPEALAFAAAAASLQVQEMGARGGLPTRAAVEEFLRTLG